MIGAERRPALLRRRRAQSGRRPDREPAARLPLARRAATAIDGDQPAARRRSPNVAEVRSLSQPLGKPLATDAGRGPASSGSPTRRLRMAAESRYVSVKPARAGRPQPHHADRRRLQDRPLLRGEPRGARASPTTSCGPRRRPASRWKGPRRSGSPARPSTVDDLKRVTTSDERRMYVLVTLGVYAILVAPAPPAGDLPLPDRDGRARLPRLAGTDRPGLPRPAPRPRRPGAGSTGRSASSCS